MPRPPLAAEQLEARALPAAPFNTYPVVPEPDPATADHVREVVARGMTLGRNPYAALYAGDSISAEAGGFHSGFLLGFGAGGYNPVASGLAALGPGLIPTLDLYRATGSFSRSSSAAFPGWRAADVTAALPGEIAATDAGVALVMVGTNDVFTHTDLSVYRALLESIVGELEAAGVVPILSTIPPNVNSAASTAAVPGVNQVIADVAAARHVPLWNLWLGLTQLPGLGLTPDGTHLTLAGDGTTFSGGALGAGQNLRNFEALQLLDRVRHVFEAPADVPPLPAWTPLKPGQSVVAATRGEGQAAVVSVYDAGGAEVDRLLAFEPGFTGGARVATADVTGDGIPDVVVGAGLGGGPVVKVFSGADGSLVTSYFAFEPSFRSGVNVAAADLDGDGVAEVVVGAGAGGGPAVAVYHGGDFAEKERFFAYEPSFRGGVTVAAGVVGGVGPAVVTGTGQGGAPVVKVFRPDDLDPAYSYFAYDPAVRTGVQDGVADLGGGGEVATAPAGGSPHVKMTDVATGVERASFFAPVGGAGGVRLGVLHAGPGKDAVLFGSGGGEPVRGWGYHGGTVTPFGPDDPTRAYGVYVG